MRLPNLHAAPMRHLIKTRKYDTLQDPSPILLDKMICEHLYQLVICIAQQHVLLNFDSY